MATPHRKGAPIDRLTKFQRELIHLFFTLPSSKHFVLAGGGAMLVHRLTNRITHDLDFFGINYITDVSSLLGELLDGIDKNDWNFSIVQQSKQFVRLKVSHVEELIIDIAIDAPPRWPITQTDLGPTYDIRDLAGRKVTALFDRAEARDFVDVYLLADLFTRNQLMHLAQTIDTGFNQRRFRESLEAHFLYRDEDFPIEHSRIDSLRSFFSEWISELNE